MATAEVLITTFVESHPADAAAAFEKLEDSEAARVIGQLPDPAACLLIERLTPYKAAVILEDIDPQRIRNWLPDLPPRVASAVLHQMTAEHRENIVAGIPVQLARQLKELLTYDPDTAGGMMEPRVTSIPIKLTVQEAIDYLRKARRQTLYYLYVTDDGGKLAGVLNLRTLLLSPPQDAIESIINRDFFSVPETMSRDEVLTLIRRHRFLALPVVDDEGRLVGVIRHDEALRAVQQGAFENLQKMVGAGSDERALSPVGTVVKRRLPWLVINLLTAFLASAVVGLFESTIQKVTALAVLLPIVSGQGGNTGAQALAVVMRGIALREIISGTARRVIVKEVMAGLINGVVIAVMTALAVWFWSKNVGLCLVIGLAMIVNMGAAGLSGAAIPLVLKYFKRDPAQSSSIFLTTVTDVVGFAAFLGFAVVFMSLLLH